MWAQDQHILATKLFYDRFLVAFHSNDIFTLLNIKTGKILYQEERNEKKGLQDYICKTFP